MDGEGILCEVTSVIGEGKQRRYEIRDIDPDLGDTATPYRASLNQMTPIPKAGVRLEELRGGMAVLALYPNTTTFYKAEIVKCVDQIVRLRFEGEESAEVETEVERRYVLPDWTGK